MNNEIQINAARYHLKNMLLISKKLLNILKGSRPGIVGLAIILSFAFMAIFAPWIAPYSVDFLAPPEDMFSIDRIELIYPVTEGYHPMVVGPTTPSESAIGGGLWFILANENGTIRMDFGSLSSGENPFEAGNMSIELDITEHGLEAPLSQVLYAVPARGYNRTSDLTSTFGERVENGLLMFMANSTFVIFDPFQKSILHQEDVGFIPKWFSQDTSSSGDMYNPPSQRKITDIWFSTLVGPYRYATLSNESRVVTFKFEYCWNNRGIGTVQRLLDLDMPVTQSPLAYTFENPRHTANATGIYVPSDNGTLYYFSSTTNGTPHAVTQFNISGEPVEFTGPLGYYRSQDSAPMLYIPTAADDSYSVKMYRATGNHSVVGEFAGEDGRVELQPMPNTANNVYVTVHNYRDGAPVNSTVMRINREGTVDTSFVGNMDTLAVEVFNVEQASVLFALDDHGVVYTAQTTISVSTPFVNRSMTELLSTGSADSQLIYLGSFGGAKYSSTMNSIEMYNAFFNKEDATLIAIQSIGTSLGALPPGVYPSGNRYVLGTDNVGHDILTLLIYGTRVALIVGLTAAFFSVIVGTLIGVVSGYYGGWVDVLIMRITDIFLTIPFLPIVLIATQVMGQSIWNIVIILAFLGWSGIARVVRAQTLSLKERSFIDAARVSGSSDSKIIIKHITPNVLPFTFLYMTLFVAGAILTEAALSYLALGDPKVVSWGNMLSTIQTTGHSLIAPWWLLPPGLAITILSMGFYLLGRGVDEIVNPRLRRR